MSKDNLKYIGIDMATNSKMSKTYHKISKCNNFFPSYQKQKIEMFTKRYLAATQLIYFLLDFLLMFLLPVS